MKLFKLKATDMQAVFGTQEEPLSPPLWLFAQANDSSAFYYLAEDSYTNENLTEVDVDTLDRETIYTTYDGSQNQMPCSNRLKDAIKMYRQKELVGSAVVVDSIEYDADETAMDRIDRILTLANWKFNQAIAGGKSAAEAYTAVYNTNVLWKGKDNKFYEIPVETLAATQESAINEMRAAWEKYG
jgi:hypothetical protein